MSLRLINTDPWTSVLKRILDHPGRWKLANKMRSWDESLYQHSVNTAASAFYVGIKMGIREENLDNLVMAAFFHDLKKSDWPKCLLSKKLEPSDLITIHAHPALGAEQIAEEWPEVPELVLRIIREHHERQDGSGYPNGLNEKDIHPLSIIVAAVDVHVALKEVRLYRKKHFTHRQAMKEVTKQFSGDVVDVLAKGVFF